MNNLITDKALRRIDACRAIVFALTVCVCVTVQTQESDIPSAIVVDGVPEISTELANQLAKYQNARSASVVGWLDDGLLIATRFGDTTQLHHVASPMGMRRQLTFSSDRIGSAAVPRIPDADGFVYLKDEGGDEEYQLFWFDFESGESTMLTSGQSRNTGVGFSPTGTKLGYTSIDRGASDWNLNLGSPGESPQTILRDEGVGWSISGWRPDEKRVIVRRFISTSESELYEYDIEQQQRTRLMPDLKPTYFSGGVYAADGQSVYFLSDLSGEYLSLHLLDLTTGEIENVTADLTWDLQSFAVTRERNLMAYVINEAGYGTLRAMKLPSHESVEMPNFGKTRIGGLRFSPDSKRLAMSMSSSTSPWDVYVYELEDGSLTRWTESELGGMPSGSLVEPEIVSYSSFDGLDIPAVVYRAQGEEPSPVLIDIHGGPTSQFRPGFSPLTQFYAGELGITVIGPNVRGSTGYGMTYARLDDGMLREHSVKDIGALLDWIETQPDLDSSRVMVEGGSYGGYMVLASMVHYSDRLVGGISVVGISNFVTFLESTRGYRRDLRRVEYGDERDPEMRAFLESIAPMNHVDKISKPMLIGQGLNDPRVPASESEQIVAALKANDVPVWYVLANDEGHGFRKKVNRDYWNQVFATFVIKHLLVD